MRYKVKNITGKRISFDYDGTLSDDFDGAINQQKNEIQDILTQLISMGNEVFIVTKRHSFANRFMGKINEYADVLQTAFKLKVPISNVIFTDRQFKAETLIKMKIDIHFENSDFEISYMNGLKHNIQNILITDPYWRDIIY